MSESITAIKKLISDYNQAHTSKISVFENENMSRHTTFKIGGCAKIFALPEDTEALVFLLEMCENFGEKYYIIGHGSNLLVDDGGFDGVMISTEGLKRIDINGNILSAGSGAMLTRCASFAYKNSLSGMECLYGIPGSIGGAVYMNAGAYGGEMADIVLETVYIDKKTHKISLVKGKEHEFGYRESIFRKNGGIIIETKLSLRSGNYNEIGKTIEKYKTARREKQPIEYPSAGSVFKRYPGKYTAQLIDEAGLKGFTVGGAQVSEKHAGFIVNKGGATARDVLSLIEIIKKKISDSHGIELETEIIYVN